MRVADLAQQAKDEQREIVCRLPRWSLPDDHLIIPPDGPWCLLVSPTGENRQILIADLDKDLNDDWELYEAPEVDPGDTGS